MQTKEFNSQLKKLQVSIKKKVIHFYQDKYYDLYGLCSDLMCALTGVLKGKKLNKEFVACAQKKLEHMRIEPIVNFIKVYLS